MELVLHDAEQQRSGILMSPNSGLPFSTSRPRNVSTQMNWQTTSVSTAKENLCVPRQVSRSGVEALSLTLECYAELCKGLTKQGSRVQPCIGLDENKYKRYELQQVLALHMLSAGSKSKKEMLERMVGLELFEPFRSTVLPLQPAELEKAAVISITDVEEDLEALSWLDGNRLASLERAEVTASSLTNSMHSANIVNHVDLHGDTKCYTTVNGSLRQGYSGSDSEIFRNSESSLARTQLLAEGHPEICAANDQESLSVVQGIPPSPNEAIERDQALMLEEAETSKVGHAGYPEYVFPPIPPSSSPGTTRRGIKSVTACDISDKLTDHQRSFLEGVYLCRGKWMQMVDSKECSKLAAEAGLTASEVGQWYQKQVCAVSFLEGAYSLVAGRDEYFTAEKCKSMAESIGVSPPQIKAWLQCRSCSTEPVPILCRGGIANLAEVLRRCEIELSEHNWRDSQKEERKKRGRASGIEEGEGNPSKGKFCFQSTVSAVPKDDTQAAYLLMTMATQSAHDSFAKKSTEASKDAVLNGLFDVSTFRLRPPESIGGIDNSITIDIDQSAVVSSPCTKASKSVLNKWEQMKHHQLPEPNISRNDVIAKSSTTQGTRVSPEYAACVFEATPITYKNEVICKESSISFPDNVKAIVKEAERGKQSFQRTARRPGKAESTPDLERNEEENTINGSATDTILTGLKAISRTMHVDDGVVSQMEMLGRKIAGVSGESFEGCSFGSTVFLPFGIHVGTVAEAFGNVHEPEFCMPDCQDVHSLFSVSFPMSVSSGQNGERYEISLMRNVDLHERHRINTWDSFKKVVLYQPENLPDAWVLISNKKGEPRLHEENISQSF